MNIQECIQEMEEFATNRIRYLVEIQNDSQSAFAIVKEFEDMFSHPEHPIMYQPVVEQEEDPLSKETLIEVSLAEFMLDLENYVPARINFLADNERYEDANSIAVEFQEYFEKKEILLYLHKL